MIAKKRKRKRIPDCFFKCPECNGFGWSVSSHPVDCKVCYGYGFLRNKPMRELLK